MRASPVVVSKRYVRPVVPNFDRAVFASADDERKVRVEDGDRHVMRIAYAPRGFERRIVPHFHNPIVSARQEIWLVRACIEFGIIDPTLLVCFQRELRQRRISMTIQTRRGEGVHVLRIEDEIQDVVGWSSKTRMRFTACPNPKL